MERKAFLKKAGVGSLAVASLPLFADIASADDGDGGRKFYFVALSRTGSAPDSDVVAMSGRGRVEGSEVEGGGEFVHFKNVQLTSPSPAFIATGGWRAVELVSFSEVGAWGRGVAGILSMRVRLNPCEGPSIPGATLTVVCNLGPAGIFNPGTPTPAEGYTLSIPNGPTFSPFGAGLTLFTRPCEDDD